MHDTTAPMAERPWLRSYDPGVPAEIDVPDEPLHAALAHAAARYPDRVAIRFFGRSVTFRELDELANRFANALIALGVKPGDRVALFMPNCPQMVLAYYGGLRAGEHAPEAACGLSARAAIAALVVLRRPGRR